MKKKDSIRCAQAVWLLMLCASCLQAGAQPSARVPAPASAPSERVQRDADKVYQMILLHRDKKSPVKAPAKDSAAGAKFLGSPLPSTEVPTATSTVSSAPQGVVSNAAANPSPGNAAPAESVLPRSVAPAASTVTAVPSSATLVPAAPESKTEPPPATTALSPREVAPPIPAAPVPLALALPTTPPRLELVTGVEPEFPGRLVRTLGTGKVVVNFVVAADGRVSEANAVSSSHKGLEPAAIAAVLQWRFKAMSGPANGTTELKFE